MGNHGMYQAIFRRHRIEFMGLLFFLYNMLYHFIYFGAPVCEGD